MISCHYCRLSSPPGQNGRHLADDMFQCVFLNKNIWMSNEISLKYVPWGLIDNISALVQIMAWRRPGVRPLSELMLTQFTNTYMQHQREISLNSLFGSCYTEIVVSWWQLFIPPTSTKLKGGYTGFTLSVCPSVDRIVSALYLQQYSSDPFHICTSYEATSKGVSRVMFV